MSRIAWRRFTAGTATGGQGKRSEREQEYSLCMSKRGPLVQARHDIQHTEHLKLATRFLSQEFRYKTVAKLMLYWFLVPCPRALQNIRSKLSWECKQLGLQRPAEL